MKRERFRDKWKKFKKKDPYDRKSRRFGNRRSCSFERGYDHKNDNDFYKRSSDRNYAEFDEKPRFKRKDPFKSKFKRLNHTYTEYKPNASNVYSKYDSHDIFDMPTNSSKSLSYQHKASERKRNRSDEYQNDKVSSKYTKNKPPETKLLNGAEKKHIYIRSSENRQKKKVSIDKSPKSYSKSKPTITFNKHKRDTKSTEAGNSSVKKASTHSDRSKAHRGESSKSSSSSVYKPPSSSSTKSGGPNSKSSSTSTKIKTSKSNAESSKKSYETTKSKDSGHNIIISKPSGLTIKINKPRTSMKPEFNESRHNDDYTPSGKRKRPKKHFSDDEDTLIESEVHRKVHCKHNDSFRKPSSRKLSESAAPKPESKPVPESTKKESSHTRKSTNYSHTHSHDSTSKTPAKSSTASSVKDYRDDTEDSDEYLIPSSTDLSVKNGESPSLKKESHSKKEVKKKIIKKTKMVSDIINLNKKITRNTQSFYESQLKLAIEMSIRDCNSTSEMAGLENEIREIEDKEDEIKQEEQEYGQSEEPQAQENENDSPSESSESDSDSDYDEHKPRRRSQKSSQKSIPEKKSKSGKSTPTIKKLIKPKRKLEDGTASTGTTTTATTANNTSTNLNNLSLNGQVKTPSTPSATKEILSPVSEPTHKEKQTSSDSSLLSGVHKCKPVDQEGLNDQLLMETKMRAFEEYLSMSERLYCGKTLVDDYILYTYNGSTNGVNRSLSSQTNSSDTLKHRDRDSEGSTSFSGPTEDAPNKEHKLNGKEEKLFRFNCSKLDLLYRVSFNILKSSLRQPQVIDLWGPKELVLFELGLFKYGKEFHEIQRDIPSKSVKEIVDMYYLWKKSSRYKLWKANRYY